MADVSVERARFAQLQQTQGQARQEESAKSPSSPSAQASQTRQGEPDADAGGEEIARTTAAAKKKKEKEMRLIVRPMQSALWTTGTLGSETVILPILAYPLWFLWKLAEIYKTKTKKDIGLPIWEDFIASFGPIEWLTFIMGSVATIFVVLLIVGVLGLIGYFFLNPAEFVSFFPLLADSFQFLFE